MKKPKECESRHSKKSSNGYQNQIQILTESKVASKLHSGPQKDHFFLAGPPMEEVTDTLKIYPKGFQNQPKAVFHDPCLPTSIIRQIWTLQHKLLGSKSGHCSNNFHILCALQLIFYFQRMSPAVCMVLRIANTVF